MPSNKRLRILIVDDDMSVQKALVALLSAMGMKADSVSGARSALAAIAQNSYDCVLLDVAMPEIDGIAALKLIRDVDGHLPIIMITGHGDISLAVKAMKEGANDFLQKPIDDLLLAKSLEEFAGRKHGQTAADGVNAMIQTRFREMTARQQEIAAMVAHGYSTQSIAANLSISPRTVDHHRANIGERMEAASLAHLIRMLLQVDEVSKFERPQQQGHRGN